MSEPKKVTEDQAKLLEMFRQMAVAKQPLRCPFCETCTGGAKGCPRFISVFHELIELGLAKLVYPAPSDMSRAEKLVQAASRVSDLLREVAPHPLEALIVLQAARATIYAEVKVSCSTDDEYADFQRVAEEGIQSCMEFEEVVDSVVMDLHELIGKKDPGELS